MSEGNTGKNVGRILEDSGTHISTPLEAGRCKKREIVTKLGGKQWCMPGHNGCSGPCIMVVLARMSESARASSTAGISEPADNFPNELARVCDSVGKSPAWHGLDAAFPSQFGR